MTSLTVAAPAKVNLTLHVTGKRADGYHLLDSIVAFADCGDVLYFEDSDTFSLRVSGPFAGAVPKDETNIVLRAVRALAEVTGHAAHATIRLEKNLPVGAGLGGGSADAAATLRGLQTLWGITVPPAEEEKLALALGADVPVCLAGKPAHIQGIGEVVTLLKDFPSLSMLLVAPSAALLTKDVFTAFGGPYSKPASLSSIPHTVRELASMLSRRHNDLQSTAISRCPDIKSVLSTLEAQAGCLLARMSGSGPACFGLFQTDLARTQAAEKIRRAQPTWWVGL